MTRFVASQDMPGPPSRVYVWSDDKGDGTVDDMMLLDHPHWIVAQRSGQRDTGLRSCSYKPGVVVRVGKLPRNSVTSRQGGNLLAVKNEPVRYR